MSERALTEDEFHSFVETVANHNRLDSAFDFLGCRIERHQDGRVVYTLGYGEMGERFTPLGWSIEAKDCTLAAASDLVRKSCMKRWPNLVIPEWPTAETRALASMELDTFNGDAGFVRDLFDLRDRGGKLEVVADNYGEEFDVDKLRRASSGLARLADWLSARKAMNP